MIELCQHTDHPEENNCPAILDWWSRDAFDSFYSLGKSQLDTHDDPSAFVKRINCPKPLPDPQTIGDDLLCQYWNKTWKKIPLEVDWEIGQFSIEDDIHWVYRDHWHTSFTLGQHHIHVDYINGPHGSNHMIRREFRIFSNGLEIGRGGGRLGWNMAVFGCFRNYPLIIVIDDYLICLHKVLQPYELSEAIGKIEPDNVLTVWQRV